MSTPDWIEFRPLCFDGLIVPCVEKRVAYMGYGPFLRWESCESPSPGMLVYVSYIMLDWSVLAKSFLKMSIRLLFE